MGDTGTISDKGKEKVASPVRTRDFVKTQAQEKLTPDPRREFLKGGMNQGESSRQQDTTKQQNTTKQPSGSAREMFTEFDNALRTSTRLHAGNDGYARSQTRTAFSPEYYELVELHASLSKKYTEEETFQILEDRLNQMTQREPKEEYKVADYTEF